MFVSITLDSVDAVFSRHVPGFCTAFILGFRWVRIADDELTWQFSKEQLRDIERSKSCRHSMARYDLQYGI